MATETSVQELVHRLEEGRWAKWVKLAVLLGAIAFVISLWFFRDAGFKGLSHPLAMDQAQISREIARGNGFTTKFIRPAALWQFEKNKGAFPLDKTPDTYHAPLNPFINSLFIQLAERTWRMTTKDLVYPSDQIIAGVSIIFYLLGVLMFYLVARRLFDHRLALIGTGLLLACQTFWDFALSGLPQMLLLFLFGCASYTLVRAMEARYMNKRPTLWLAGTALAFGLMALTHGLTIWMFIGALIFAALFFRPLGRDAAVMLGIFLLCYTPWMVRNYKVCGSPVGLGWFTGLFQVRGSDSEIMRSMDVSLKGVSPTVFRQKIQGQTLFQFSNIYDFLGNVLLAPVFFIALLHLFKKPETAMLRWCVLLMWLAALLGMSIFGFPEEAGAPVRANDLHVLFIPLMTFYGLALILVMWTRLELNYKLVRIGFIALLYLVSAAPFLQQLSVLLGPPRLPWHWPPYIPPYIAVLNTYTTEKEIIASDMPWAVAWYADRKSLWIPMTIKDFMALNDDNKLHGRIVGLYLTPITGNKALISEIVKGEYKEWSPFIMRRMELRDFPLKAATGLPKDGECIFLSDRDRWTNRED